MVHDFNHPDSDEAHCFAQLMPHILIVDDDENSTQMLSSLLRAEGYETVSAANLKEARQQLLLRPPRVVLLDLELPDGSGLDLFDEPELRGNAEIVLITGHATVETSIQALRVDAADY